MKHFEALIKASSEMYVIFSADDVIEDLFAGDTFPLTMPVEEAIGKSLSFWSSASLYDKLKTALDLTRVSHQAQSTFFEVQNPSYHRFFEVRMTPYLKGSVMAVFRDITELEKAYFAQKKLTHQLAEGSALLQTVVFNSSDEMKEPLRIITSFCHLIDQAGSLNDKQKEYFGYIKESAWRMRAVMDGLIEYAELSKPDLKSEPVDVWDCWLEALAAKEQYLAKHELLVDTPSQFNAMVRCNKQHLVLALKHLLRNAMRFAKEGQPAKVKLSVESQGDMLHLHLHDEGIGIKPEYHEAIFEMYTQIDNSKRNIGAGIGLALCRKIAQIHGGHISVQSVLGEGSRFSMAFPLHDSL